MKPIGKKITNLVQDMLCNVLVDMLLKNGVMHKFKWTTYWFEIETCDGYVVVVFFKTTHDFENVFTNFPKAK
jgi:hypothetical protein